MFGDVDFDPTMAYAACPFEEQLEALTRAVEAGKVEGRGGKGDTLRPGSAPLARHCRGDHFAGDACRRSSILACLPSRCGTSG